MRESESEPLKAMFKKSVRQQIIPNEIWNYLLSWISFKKENILKRPQSYIQLDFHTEIAQKPLWEIGIVL